MKITALEPIVLAAGSGVDVTRADSTQDAFLVRVHTDAGLVGLGEADTSPYVARTMVEMPSSHAVAQGFSEMLVGSNPLRSAAAGGRCTRAATTMAAPERRCT